MVTLHCNIFISVMPCSIIYVMVTYFCNNIIYIMVNLDYNTFYITPLFCPQNLFLHIVCLQIGCFLVNCVGYKYICPFFCVFAPFYLNSVVYTTLFFPAAVIFFKCKFPCYGMNKVYVI